MIKIDVKRTCFQTRFGNILHAKNCEKTVRTGLEAGRPLGPWLGGPEIIKMRGLQHPYQNPFADGPQMALWPGRAKSGSWGAKNYKKKTVSPNTISKWCPKLRKVGAKKRT